MSADTVLIASNGTLCELCRDKRECTHAYNGSRGLFCGTWLRGSLQREAYCCPEGTGCLSPTSIDQPAQCGVSKLSPQATSRPSLSLGQRLKDPQLIVALVLVLLVASIIIGMYFYTTRPGYHPRRISRRKPKRNHQSQPQPQSPTSSSDSREPYHLHQRIQS